MGLGFTRDNRALPFLRQLAGQEIWNKHSIKDVKLVTRLRRKTLHAGIALVGTKEAIKTIEELGKGEGKDFSEEYLDAAIYEAQSRLTGEYLERRKRIMP